MSMRIRGLKNIAVAAAAVVAVSGFAFSAVPATAAVPASDAVHGSKSAPVTLTFWEYYSGTQLTWLQDQVKKFEASNPNVTVKLVQVDGTQQDQKLLAATATHTGPDLFINNIVVDYPTLVAGKVMKNLTPYWNAYADKSQFPSSAVWKTDGKVYNLMSYTNLVGLYYNKTILSQYGITKAPTTLNQLQSDMAKVKAGGKYQALAESGAPTVEGAWLFAPQLLGQGIGYCNIGSSSTSAKVTAAFNRVALWAKDGYTPQATATWTQNDSWAQFSTGKYAFGLLGNWELGNAKSVSFSYGTAQFPAPTGGTSIVYPGGEGFGIGADSKHPSLAWKFLESAILSKQGGQSVYNEAGSIPVRADLADIPAIKNNPLVQPFVAAAHTSAAWPNNKNTANMQTALGTAVSSVISGQSTAAQGKQSAIKTIEAAEKAGGGTCK
jgi:multiple sugar transport system substrate-binding protein